MNEAQRSVIQRHLKQLADDIMMTEDFYGSLFQYKIFERNMIANIKAERTPDDQVYKMLEMLTKRGPEAFDSFVDILKDDYPWLAAMLETSYRNESFSRQNSTLTICTCGNVRVDNEKENSPPAKQSNEISPDGDIKTRVGQFIHKQFGHSKRISQTDKKMMEKWLSEQIQVERKRQQKEASPILHEDCIREVTMEPQVEMAPQEDPVRVKLSQVYIKIRDEVQTETRSESPEGSENNFDECDGDEKTKIADLTNLVDKEVDKLINRLNEVESQVTQCHYILGDPDCKHSLPALVKDVVFMRKQYEQELAKEKETSEKTLNEVYDYCKSINKLENTRKQLRGQLDTLEKEINSVKSENTDLKDRCKILEAEKLQHLEKEKTIDNLRKMIQELKQSKVDENANPRVNYGAQRPLRRTTRMQTRRGSFDQGLPLGNSPVRKNGNKQTLYTSRRKPITKY